MKESPNKKIDKKIIEKLFIYSKIVTLENSNMFKLFAQMIIKPPNMDELKIQIKQYTQ